MLLPSDVARLVLGYLQEEGLSATSQTFIHESPNLREYAEHTTGDGTIPACVFSIFGKGLAAILNEYVAVKAKESGHEVPLVMTSLWKKLDFTLNQIKSLQNSPVVSASQRTRSRVGLANMARQRVLTVASSSGVVCSSVSESSSIISPAHPSYSMLGHSTPVSYVGPQSRAAPGGVAALQPLHDGSRSLSTPRDSPIQVVISEHRLASGPVSPGRRKWDTPRKRGGATGSGGPSKTALAPNSLSADAQPEEQLVIQNARDKILGDRSLQEKLAENINKILSSDGVPQTSKASSAAVEPDQSIDEILGLEGEIHMSDDAIHDILEQTESDPAFQALFDLFDYHKSKDADGDEGDGGNARVADENEPAGPSSAVQLLQSTDPGPAERDLNVSDATAGTLKARPGQERKTRKPAAPTLLRKTILDSSGRASRIENSSARLLISHVEPRGASSAAGGSGRKQKPPATSGGGVTQMDMDEPLNTPPPPVDGLLTQEPPSQGTTLLGALSKSDVAQLPPGEERSASDGDTNHEHQQAKGPSQRTDPSPPAAADQREVVSPVAVQVNGAAAMASCRPAVFGPGGDRLTAAPASVPSASSASAPAAAAPSTPGPPAASASSGAPAAARLSPPTAAVPVSPRRAGEPSGVVSLKIIVSDSQEGDSQGDGALNQAFPSVPSDKIPTIYLSSPIKSPGRPATPKAGFDEAAQAVSGLQRSEGCGSPLVCKAGGAAASAAAPQAQQRYIIQLPVDTASPGLPGPAASYFFVAPPPEGQSRPVLLPAGLATAQHAVAPPGLSTGPALLLPSPVKPVVLPVSVLGQNTMGNLTVVSSQLVDVTNPKPVQPAEKVQAEPRTAAPEQSMKSGAEKNATVPPPPGQQDAAKASSHRRILCFHSPASEVRSQVTPTPAAPNASPHTRQAERPHRRAAHATKPAILGSSKPKRRVETVRCPADPQGGGGLAGEAVSLQTRQRGSAKKTPRKQMHVVHDPEPQSANSASPPEAEKKSQTGEGSGDGSPRPGEDRPKAEDACSSGSLPSHSPAPSGGRTDGEKSSLKGREGRTERRTSSQEAPDVRANKENEMKGGSQERKQPPPSSAASRELSPPAVPAAKSSKAASKTSSLAKQAAEMLQDLQGLSSPPPGRKAGPGGSDLGPPGTDRPREAPADCQRTPSRQRSAEGTPKRLLPPNTPDVPTCSPASEAGSENSINMAAHTLMILSRAAIARTGTPLKDSLRQEEAGDKSPASSKSKRRKQSPVGESPPAKRERRRSPSSKKDKERKKLMDGFPHDLDVDKFLSSLHYDE
ncbi:protein NPAT isoform X2 [Fundulus heteroclitus]|uniref:protein NPAT isoform X2 n=1 Tax=Fundulus heteroclitus TaxID=8078 RepID=UPI00165AA7BE|nr:protein NPAT isoform X2 [Fundulus heteroclitus]